MIFFNSTWGGGRMTVDPFATAGAKVPLKQAVIVASILNFRGCFDGFPVTNFVRKKIVSQTIFEDNPGALMLGMLCTT